MRKLYFVLFGLVLLLAGLVVAQAEKQAGKPFLVAGTITSIDDVAKTLVVDYGATIYTNENTVVVFNQDTTLTYSFDDLKTELYVKIQADIAETVIIAKKICVPINQTPK